MHDGGKMRTFAADVAEIELVWHRDEEDRKVTVLSGEGWKFQYDNEIPFQLKKGDVFNIESMRYHRIIKGTTELVLLIHEEF
jgi:quercetin dioxygenase-like cupin family protein